MAITISGSGITSANIADGTIVNADINSSAAIAGTKVSGSFGKVLQVVTATFSGTQQIDTEDNSFTDITNLSVSITPASTSSRILIMVALGKVDNGSSANTNQFMIFRDSTRIGLGDDDGSRIRGTFSTGVHDSNGGGGISFTMVDSPSTTSATTYKVGASKHATASCYINRWRTDTNNGDGPSMRTSSTITVMEIGA